MGIIKVLDKNLSNMIAAGEVVERPASVVKELVENALDACASEITVEIRHGGKTYIRVTDNGSGMTEEDAKLAFTRHATSKIKTEQDLFKITTKGFRGEALAAISSVSKVTLQTSQKRNGFGTEIIIEGGEMISCNEIGCALGTTIIVENLFYNTPARMNFLKKDATEAANILSMIQKIAIAEHDVAFTLITDGRTTLSVDKHLPMKERIYSAIGSEIADNLVFAENLNEEVCVTGFVSMPRYCRSNRNYQIIFVNNRVVRSKTVTAAIDKAYYNLLMHGKYPIVILNICLLESRVDVNVHPAKSEVRFFDDKQVFDAVYFAVRNAISSEHQINPEVTAYFEKLAAEDAQKEPEPATVADGEAIAEAENDEEAAENKSISEFRMEFEAQHAPDPNQTRPSVPHLHLRRFMGDGSFEMRKKQVSIDMLSPEFCLEKADDSYLFKDELPYRYVGELFKTYILIESGTSFYLVDKHAAHERILFEKIRRNYLLSDTYCQRLIIGIPISLTPEEAVTARYNKEKLAQLGFDFDDFGDTDVLLRSIPYMLSPGDTVSTFTETIQILCEDRGIDMTEFENQTIKNLACKAAIKAGYESSDEELERFIKDLLYKGDVSYCPHGRPIICEYTKESVEKAFKRIV